MLHYALINAVKTSAKESLYSLGCAYCGSLNPDSHLDGCVINAALQLMEEPKPDDAEKKATAE